MSSTICETKHPAFFALIDGNNFFVSCERVFNPSLNNKPVVVLSHNDGCAIARSNEAKQLGIPMGAPLHTFSHLIKPHCIAILSSNFELYTDLSRRMMCILKTCAPDIEIYSIDEAFLTLSYLSATEHNVFATRIYDTILKHIGIPTTIGIAPTKTLAKIANRQAKHLSKIHLILNTENLINQTLRTTNVGDVWGVGKALTHTLRCLGVYTSYDLAQKKPMWARQHLSIMGERLVRELQSIPCIPRHINKQQKSIQITRSLRRNVTTFNELSQLLSAHATRLGEKLRQAKLTTSEITIFCQTNRFSKTPHYKGEGSFTFTEPTNDTQTLIKGTMHALIHAFLDGHSYHSTGIHALNLTDEGMLKQKALFPSQLSQNQTARKKCIPHINSAIDTLNKRLGKNTIFWASSGIQNDTHKPAHSRSPRYTTNWHELAIVR